MAWSWEIIKSAKKDLGRLDRQVARRITEKLDFWVGSGKPLEFAGILTDYELGAYRFRMGDYRIIFDVEGETIVVLAVGHRRDIYR